MPQNRIGLLGGGRGIEVQHGFSSAHAYCPTEDVKQVVIVGWEDIVQQQLNQFSAVVAERSAWMLKLHELECRVVALESLVKSGDRERQADPSSDPRLIDVVRLTNSMFPGVVTIEVEADPQEPNAPFVFFNVESSEDGATIIAKEREWHNRVSQMPPGSSGHLRLCVFPA